MKWISRDSIKSGHYMVFQMSITADSVSFDADGFYDLTYRAPLREIDRLKISGAMSGGKIFNFHNLKQLQDSCVISYEGATLPDTTARRLIRVALSMTPFLPEIHHNIYGLYCPKINPEYNFVDSICWEKLAIREGPWRPINNEIYSDGRASFYDEQVIPFNYRRREVPIDSVHKEIDLSSKDINSISDILYRCNPRGYLSFSLRKYEDKNLISFKVDDHEFFRCYAPVSALPESYQQLLNIGKKYLQAPQ